MPLTAHNYLYKKIFTEAALASRQGLHTKAEGQVVPVHVMRVYRRRRHMALFLLDLGARWR
jgi:hypothetical protein